jgi:hypothetical protein
MEKGLEKVLKGIIRGRKEKRKMANVKVTIDGKEYTEEQFRRDVIRMFDSCRDSDCSECMGSTTCNGVGCDDCPLYSCSCSSEDSKAYSFEIIKIVHEWAIEHPIIRNRDMLIKTFGDDVLKYIDVEAYKDRWMFKEYKKPKGEKHD